MKHTVDGGDLRISDQALCILGGCNGAGKTTLAKELLPRLGLILEAKACGYRIVLHYIVIDSAAQAIERVALRVKLGGHHVPDADVQRRFDRSRRHFLNDYLPLADEWGVWENQSPPPRQIADSSMHTPDQLQALLTSLKLREAPPQEMSDMSKIVLEAGRVATEKMLDLYKRMGIEVTPQMTLAQEKPQARRKTR